ncbi:hypothetical protein WJX81_003454 [Elliptochloris bilobata]|uniref:PPM-type phosphatase domain-containing protein n=1 Tax=Elliptochloris bilobata TaxID=381761 RepID=A0AAW1S0V6_9CHLO
MRWCGTCAESRTAVFLDTKSFSGWMLTTDVNTSQAASVSAPVSGSLDAAAVLHGEGAPKQLGPPCDAGAGPSVHELLCQQVVKQQALEQQVALLQQQALASQAALAAAVSSRSVSMPKTDPQVLLALYSGGRSLSMPHVDPQVYRNALMASMDPTAPLLADSPVLSPAISPHTVGVYPDTFSQPFQYSPAAMQQMAAPAASLAPQPIATKVQAALPQSSVPPATQDYNQGEGGSLGLLPDVARASDVVSAAPDLAYASPQLQRYLEQQQFAAQAAASAVAHASTGQDGSTGGLPPGVATDERMTAPETPEGPDTGGGEQKQEAHPEDMVTAGEVASQALDEDEVSEVDESTDMEVSAKLKCLCIGSATALGQRPDQQDRSVVIARFRSGDLGRQLDTQRHSLAAVFDGHKRAEAAEIARDMLPSLLANDPMVFDGTEGKGKGGDGEGVSMALHSAFIALDDEILKRAIDGPLKPCEFGGTTALVALRISDVLYVAHAGDSRAVLSSDSQALRLTSDHKPDRPDECARVWAAGGRIMESRNRVVSAPKEHGRRVTLLAMTRALGDPEYKLKGGQCAVIAAPEVRRLRLRPGDSAIILASDGLWDVMDDSEAVDVVEKVLSCQHEEGREAMREAGNRGNSISEEQAQHAAQALVKEAMRRHSRDNTTVVVMLLSWV